MRYQGHETGKGDQEYRQRRRRDAGDERCRNRGSAGLEFSITRARLRDQDRELVQRCEIASTVRTAALAVREASRVSGAKPRRDNR